MSSFFSLAKQELFSTSSLLVISCISIFYFALSIWLLNYALISQTIGSALPLLTKVQLYVSLLGGAWTAMSLTDFILLIITSLFVGINMYLAIKTVTIIEHHGKVRWAIGGATLVSMVTTGCGSCGFSLLSILGLSASVAIIKNNSLLLHMLALLLLIISTWYMVKKLQGSRVCNVD